MLAHMPPCEGRGDREGRIGGNKSVEGDTFQGHRNQDRRSKWYEVDRLSSPALYSRVCDEAKFLVAVGTSLPRWGAVHPVFEESLLSFIFFVVPLSAVLRNVSASVARAGIVSDVSDARMGFSVLRTMVSIGNGEEQWDDPLQLRKAPHKTQTSARSLLR